MDKNEEKMRQFVGGVHNHKDLQVAAIVDEQDHVIGTQSFPTTRQDYRQMLACCVIFRLLRLKFWKSRHRIDMIGVGVERMMIWTPRTQRTPPLQVNAPLYHDAGTVWWKHSGS